MSVPQWEQGSAPGVQFRLPAFLACILTALLAVTSSAEARRHHHVAGRFEPHAPSAPAAMAIDLYTGRVLYAKNAGAPRYPASVTKVMTLYLLFDALRDGKLTMRTPLRVSEHAAEQSPTKLGLEPGETIAVADAIGAIVTKSANDIAVVVAEALAGSEDEFARAMTQKARTIGMLNTTFRNASGLPNYEQKTTAEDLIILGRHILADHPERSKVFATRYFQYRGEIMRNHNTMLFSYEGMEGMKTGFTSAAGFNLLASAHRGEKRILAVVLGGASAGSRNAAMRAILDSSWSKAMTQTAARRSGVEVASLREPPRTPEGERAGRAPDERRYHDERRAYDERQERREKRDAGVHSAPAKAAPEPLLQGRQKPHGAAAGMLISSIENGLVAKRPLGRPKSAPEPAADMTTDEPEEHPETGAAQTASIAPPRPQEVARNETLAAQALPTQIQNVSIHNKTVRVAEVEPLDAISFDAASVERQLSHEPRVVKIQAANAMKAQSASASADDGAKPQKLATASLPAPRDMIDHPGPYYVQVGSFPDEAQAAERLDSVKHTLGATLLKAHPEFVVPVELPNGVTMYRARLARFTNETQAKSACKKLRVAGIECWDIRAR